VRGCAGGVLLLLVLWGAGCWVPRTQGVWHRVEPGQTLWRIAKTYGVDLQELAEVNDIQDPSKIQAGQRLFIPGVSAARTVKPAPARATRTAAAASKGTAASRPPPRVKVDKGRLLWPVEGGVLTSRFGMRGDERHDGIDIGAPTGTPIRAADAGEVVYAESTGGYGNLVILRHRSNLVTVYAHNRRNLVREGQTVSRGQRIAEVGQTGRATGPHLHFEVHQRGRLLDPVPFLRVWAAR